MNIDEYRETSRRIRRSIIRMAARSRSPHVGSCLSCADIFGVLYGDWLRFAPWDDRDICILSKGHAAMTMYAALACKGIMDPAMLEGYFQDCGTLPAHLDRTVAQGIEVSTGSLGHGFNIGLGMAHGLKKQGRDRRVVAVIGDGESQEGSIWEGALFAPKLGLDNFTAVMDFNNLQGYGRPCELCSFEPVGDKFRSFGWFTLEIDGHDHGAIRRALDENSGGRPKMIVARTVKGKGVSFMEDQLSWHYYIVTPELEKQALEELT